MRRIAALVSVLALVPSVAFAKGPSLLGGWETAAAKKPAPESSPSTPAPKANAPAEASSGDAPGMRRDPEGKTGISPFWESINAGDRAYLAQDYAGAVAAFQKAVEAEPQNPMGQLRLGTALLAAGREGDAETALSAALRFSARQPEVKAKVLVAIARLREAQQSTEDAIDTWQSYLTFAKQNPSTKTYPEVGAARLEVLQKWLQLKKDGAEVKARIEQRAREADEALRKSQ